MSVRYTPHDEHIVDQFLLEAGIDAAELKPALLDLRSLALAEPPAPSPELAALMTAGSTKPAFARPATVSLEARRRLKRRLAISALIVAGSMSVGTAAVAAVDPGFRQQATETIATVIETVTHGRPGRSAPDNNPGLSNAPGQNKDRPTPGNRPTPGSQPTPGKGNQGSQDTKDTKTQGRGQGNPGAGNSGQGTASEAGTGQSNHGQPDPGRAADGLGPERRNSETNATPSQHPTSPAHGR